MSKSWLLVAALGIGCSRGEGLPESSSGGAGSGGALTTGGRGGSSSGGRASGEAGADGVVVEPPIQACEDAVGLGAEPLIDDFEDGDDATLRLEGREGGAYPYDDGSGGLLTFAMDEIEGGREQSTRALHTSGSGFSDWGAGFAIEPRVRGTGADGEEISCWYDASVYAGLRFFARGHQGKPGVKLAVRVKVTMPQVIPLTEGGSCNPRQGLCYDDHGVDLVFSDEWTEYALPFAELTQQGWGIPVGPFDPAKIRKIQFTTLEDVDYDYWVDDIGFYPAVGP